MVVGQFEPIARRALARPDGAPRALENLMLLE